ncbi:MAG: serine protease [Mycetocola sp.]
MLAAISSSVQAECVDPSTLVRSTVSITRYTDEGEQKTGSLGIRGTAWFLSATSLVTVDHVTAAMRLSDHGWKQVEISEGENRQSIDVRILRTAGYNAEKISVLELRSAYAGAQALQVGIEPLAAEERVVSLAYPGNRLRFATGRFVRYGDSDRVAGTALFEMYDGDDRLVLDHGASGAPILDCKGRVIAVVSNVFTQTLQSPFRAIRMSTAWGQPNVVSVPIQVLSVTSETGSVRR